MIYYFAVNLYGESASLLESAPFTTKFVMLDEVSYGAAVRQIVTAAGASFGGLQQIRSPKMIREIEWERLDTTA